MLFDLRGKRRRMVQVVYLVLAVLMGGGLVLFGIGGDVQGGLVDAFTGGNSSGSGGGANLVDKRIERNEKALKANPRNTNAMKELVRAHYQLATDNADPNTGQFASKGKEELRKASALWERYLATIGDKAPDSSLASVMLQAYAETALNDPAKGVTVAEIVAEARPSAQAYYALAEFASKAGQSRKADLAGKKAVELAPKDQRAALKAQLELLKNPGAAAPHQDEPGAAPHAE